MSMMPPDLYALSLSVQVSSGPLLSHRDGFSAGSLDRVIWLRGVRLPGVVAGLSATVVDRETSLPLRDLELSVAAMDDLGALIRALGLPARVPAVKGRVDTSDGWTDLCLTLTWNEQPPVQFTVHAMSSGYEGPDAMALRALLAALSSLVGVRGPIF